MGSHNHRVGALAHFSQACLRAIRVKGRRRCQGSCDGFEHAGRIQENIVIPETQNPVALEPEKGIACFVPRIDCVLAAIDLDDQASLPTDKIGDIGTDRLLAHELAAIQSS